MPPKSGCDGPYANQAVVIGCCTPAESLLRGTAVRGPSAIQRKGRIRQCVHSVGNVRHWDHFIVCKFQGSPGNRGCTAVAWVIREAASGQTHERRGVRQLFLQPLRTLSAASFASHITERRPVHCLPLFTMCDPGTWHSGATSPG